MHDAACGGSLHYLAAGVAVDRREGIPGILHQIQRDPNIILLSIAGYSIEPPKHRENGLGCTANIKGTHRFSCLRWHRMAVHQSTGDVTL
uniref:Uncharacterized protein n=1 Tax=Knipowitschia caucasica TaxID=637954 RepID=A0AAV2KX38_KNICA